MMPASAFEIGIQGYTVRLLSAEDIPVIFFLWEKCLDYMLLVDGHAASLSGVEEDFDFVPPGKSRQDKFVFGIFDQQGDLVGILDTLCGYPQEATWWIATLLFVPEARSQGLGQAVFQAFAEYVKARGGKTIMLGVVEENQRAYQFWSKVGFEFLRQTEPQQFGDKTQRVWIMRQDLLLDQSPAREEG